MVSRNTRRAGESGRCWRRLLAVPTAPALLCPRLTAADPLPLTPSPEAGGGARACARTVVAMASDEITRIRGMTAAANLVQDAASAEGASLLTRAGGFCGGAERRPSGAVSTARLPPTPYRQGLPSRACPPRKGRSASGIAIVPSACWWFSSSAMIVRVEASAVLFSVCTKRTVPSVSR